MGKISKKDQDPRQTDKDKTEIEKILSKKSEHFMLGTRVVIANTGGTIERISKDGGRYLLVLMDDGHYENIVNPRMKWRDWNGNHSRRRR